MNFHSIKQVDLEADKAAAQEAADRAAGRGTPEPVTDVADPAYRVLNFGPGPATLPLEVLVIAQAEMLNFAGTGMSIMEMSHRHPQVTAIIQETEALLRELMTIPKHYKVLFTQGGATHQFEAVPLNLYRTGVADYLVSGFFAERGAAAAEKHLSVNRVGSSEDRGYRYVPPFNPSEAADYYHYTPNNTIYGTAVNQLPPTSVPVVADMTSCILSQDYLVEKFGVIFASPQKQLGIAGMGVVIAREDLLGKAKEGTPTLYDWSTYVAHQNMPNTPPVFAIYIMNLYLHWVKSNGGVTAMAQQNRVKAALLYRIIDSSPLYKGYADPDARSFMNVTFSCGTSALDEQFATEAEAAGMVGLRGFRTVGGLRASIYNAMSIEGVEALGRFMLAFEAKHVK